MSPTKTNASESSRPRKASAQKPRKPFKQRKIPIPLHGVPFCHYGAKMEDFFNGDATIRVQPPVVSDHESAAPLHVTTQDTLYLTSYSPPANFHSQIPVSERCLDDATRVNRGAEPSDVPIPFHYGPEFNIQSAGNILSMTNPCQSYVQYANNDQSCDFIPLSSSTGGLSMEYCDERYQQWLDPNTHSPQSILSNHDASTTFPTSGNSYNDVMMYAEFTGTAPGSSHLTTLTNDGTALHFPNYDANNPHSHYM